MKFFHRVPEWLGLVMVAAVLRFVNLGAENLWYDESFTAWLSRLNWAQLWPALRGDVHPPLWYIIEWANVRILGDSEFALRVPSALLGIAAVLLVWRLGLALHFERRTAFTAGLFAAVLPGAVYYSQDARMYPLLTCCVLLAALAAIADQWFIFAIASAGAVYSQNLGWLYVAAIGLAVGIPRLKTWRRLIKPALAGAGVVAAWLPWAGDALHQVQAVGSGFWLQKLSLGGAVLPFLTLPMGWRIAEVFQLHVFTAALVMSLVGLIASRRWVLTRDGLIVLAVAIGAPLLAGAVSVAWRSIYLHRAMLPAAMMLLLFWAYAFNHLSKPNRLATAAVVLPALALSLTAHYFPAQGGRGSQSIVKDAINQFWQPHDVVYYLAIDGALLEGYYLRPLPYALFPHSGDLNQSLTNETKVAMGLREVHFDDLRNAGYVRAWLIVSNNPLTSKTELDEFDRINRDYLVAPLKRSGPEDYATVLYLVLL